MAADSDGISPESIKNILKRMRELGQRAENITFGMGASLLQKCNRDTMRFAMKASSICVNGVHGKTWQKFPCRIGASNPKPVGLPLFKKTNALLL